VSAAAFPRNKILNIREFSSLIGVSTATVSRVFSGKNTVAEKTRKRVLEQARQYGFRPSQVAKSSFGGRTKSVGVLLCRLTCSYFADIAIGIQRELLQADYLPIIIDLREDGERAGLKRLIDHRVDGIILSTADQSLHEGEIREITRFNLPVVTVDSRGYEMSYDNVCSDERGGGRLAGEYLLSHGHRHIGFVSQGPENSSARLQRLEGLREALAEADAVVKQADILNLSSSGGSEDDLIHQLCHYLASPARPSAIYAYNDNDAIPIYRAAATVGLRIPEDLSVIGHAGLDFSAVMSPALTTIQQDGGAIGRDAAAMILERLDGYSSESRKHVHPVEIVERDSVQAPQVK
jgi:LacI family transcriptional regulator